MKLLPCARFALFVGGGSCRGALSDLSGEFVDVGSVSDLAIGDVHIPIPVLHGDEDNVIPISLARRLFELANEPKTFLRVSGGKHLVLGLAEVFPLREWIDEKTGVAHRHGDARE
jgi:fermentation-respiration switch protein FrsA (DUF1100 family)